MKTISSYQVLPLATSLLMLALAGCGRDTVKVYHVDTNEAVTIAVPPTMAPAATPSAAMPPAMPAGLPAPDHSGLPPLKYTLPAGWAEKELTQMRGSSFSILEGGKQADVSVIPLQGMAGGDFANVN